MSHVPGQIAFCTHIIRRRFLMDIWRISEGVSLQTFASFKPDSKSWLQSVSCVND